MEDMTIENIREYIQKNLKANSNKAEFAEVKEHLKDGFSLIIHRVYNKSLLLPELEKLGLRPVI